jgi:alkanesulfonate monooxygenase SsuD/methylene tetrahydromethanopterin reductase-like flavin-dependent oxidoreductase (luciferase family)
VSFGLIVPQGWREDLPGRDFEAMVTVAQAAERLGFESIWLYDHLQTRNGDRDALFECWTTLAALSRETSRVRLGQIVTCALYRNPGLLAQMAATLDAASGGRLIVGIGAGWDEREFRDFGYGDALPSIGNRLGHLEETLQILRARQRSPILVGGGGEKVLLRLVAQYADLCNFTDSFDPAFYRHKLDVLRRHCNAVGRDYDAIRKTASFTVADGVDFAALRQAGIEDFIVYLDPPTDLGLLEAFARRAGLDPEFAAPLPIRKSS